MDEETRECIADSIAKAISQVGVETPAERRVAELEAENQRLKDRLDRKR